MNLRLIIAVGTLMLAPVQAASQDQPSMPDWQNAETVTIKLNNFKFTPSTITLRQGRPYTLRLENQTSGGHDFSAKQFFSDALILETDKPMVAKGKIVIDAGETVEVHVLAPHAGTYKLRCTHFMHSAFGMKGEIVVQ